MLLIVINGVANAGISYGTTNTASCSISKTDFFFLLHYNKYLK